MVRMQAHNRRAREFGGHALQHDVPVGPKRLLADKTHASRYCAGLTCAKNKLVLLKSNRQRVDPEYAEKTNAFPET
jgi:hypothetical protein